ncbi:MULTISPECIES: glucose 1-dehydrogenase [Pseudoalteromonas]|uniref:SDR family oxidoreductase n=1 Tax=Pseudoalteromonas fuliginea TaxID=1872678 RepID=A0ABQ6RIL7_9GAMM|nr:MULTISPECIES: glucose 1-dehydrogenase [Pseudoalteromonas]KAA1157122.1 SDR family oxidoreductase [Pseudoalteromonas fuliginea]KAA1167552.1 SDR family oxidoreductase [Pseudoalteromonas fuliginea]MDQ2045731.1 SDR family oxidoreductase [Pseudoalteromonas sp. 20-92]
MSSRLLNEVAIVTGAADGIGKTVARVFCEQGAKVCVADINKEMGESVVAELKSKGFDAIFAHTDISDETAIKNMVEKVVNEIGKPSILVNNAALISPGRNVDDVTPQMWRDSFAVNVEGMWQCAVAVLEHMKDLGRGSIINVGSVHSYKIVPGYFPYAVTKHAVIGLTKNLAVEYAKHNIRVNALCPGMIETPMAFKSWEQTDDPQASRKAMGDVHPLKRNGTTEEIAYPAVFLASSDSSFMTGQSLIIDGGRSVIYHD